MKVEAIPTAAADTRAVDGRLVVILVTVFLNIVGVYMILPVLPFYATAYGASSFEIGLLTGGLFFAGQFLLSPTFGALSDRWGRRWIILIGIAGELAGYVIMGFSTSLNLLFLSRIIAGAFAGNTSATQAYIADITPFRERTRAFGLLGAAFSGGLLLGPVIGYPLAQIDVRAPAFGAAALLALNLIAGLFLIPETFPPERRAQQRMARQLNPFAAFGPLFARAALRGPLLATLLFNIALYAWIATFAEFASQKFGLGPAAVDGFFIAQGVVNIFVQGVLLRVLSAHLPDVALILAGTAIYAAGNLGTAFSPSPGGFWGSASLLGGGYSLTRGPLTSLTTKMVGPTEQGWVNGGIQSTIALGSAIGAAGFGWVYQSVGPPAPFWTAAAVIFVAGVAVLMRAQPAPALAPEYRAATSPGAASPSLAGPRGKAALSPDGGPARPSWKGAARPMLVGSLDGLGLPAIITFLSSLNKSGHLRLWRGDWKGEVCFGNGRLVEPSFQDQGGPAAVHAIALALSQGEFAFVQGDPAADGDLVESASMDPNQLIELLNAVPAQQIGLAAAIRSPRSIPRVVEPSEVPDRGSEVVLRHRTLRVFMAVNGTRTVEQITENGDLGQTLSDLVTLLELGLIRIEGPGP